MSESAQTSIAETELRNSEMDEGAPFFLISLNIKMSFELSSANCSTFAASPIVARASIKAVGQHNGRIERIT